MTQMLEHETSKAWELKIEMKGPDNEPVDLTGFDLRAQLRRAFDDRRFVSLSLGEGLTYEHPDVVVNLTAEQLAIPPGYYWLGLEYVSPLGVESDTMLIEVHLTKRFIVQ